MDRAEFYDLIRGSRIRSLAELNNYKDYVLGTTGKHFYKVIRVYKHKILVRPMFIRAVWAREHNHASGIRTSWVRYDHKKEMLVAYKNPLPVLWEETVILNGRYAAVPKAFALHIIKENKFR